MLLLRSSCTHAAANTPAEATGRSFVANPTRVPGRWQPSRNNGGADSASCFSRPARRSLALEPACSLNRPRRPFCIEVRQSLSLPPSTAPIATGCYVELGGKALAAQHIGRILLNISPARVRSAARPHGRCRSPCAHCTTASVEGLEGN